MIQEKTLHFNTDNLVFADPEVEKHNKNIEVKTPVKPAIKPYLVERDLELEFELDQELTEQFNNFLAEEQYYAQDFKTKMKALILKKLKRK